MSESATIPTAIGADACANEPPLPRGRPLTNELKFDGGVLSLGADRCYWAILSDLPNGADGEARRYAFEPWLPAPLESVETRFVRFGVRIIACGVDREFFHGWIEDYESRGRRVESVVPAALPNCIATQLDIAVVRSSERILHQLEFRSAAYESPRRRRRRGAIAAIALMALVITSALASAGFMRHAHAASDAEAAAGEAIDRLAVSIVGESSSASIDSNLRLEAEVRRLESTRDRSASGLIADDAGLTLASLLAAWPVDVRTQIDSVRIDPELITIRGRVPDAASAESLALAIESGLIGWSAQSSNVSKGREGYDFSLALSSQHEESAP